MKYCPICGKELLSGTVCLCGYDPSCDYENYFSLVPVSTGAMSIQAQRIAYYQKLLDAQRKTYEEKIAALMNQQTTLEAQIRSLNQTQKKCESEIQALHETTQLLLAQQQAYEIRLEKLETQNQQSVGPPGIHSDVSTENSENTAGKQVKHSPAPRRTAGNQTAVQKSAIIPAQIKNANIGDVVPFGHYWQSKTQSDGKTAIEWIVLTKDSSKALLISRYALDAKPYNKEDKEVTWKTCSVKNWLNKEFYVKAFNQEEQNIILTGMDRAELNPKYTTEKGTDPKDDHLFLLSVSEAEKYFDSDKQRASIPTEYAKSHGAYTTQTEKTCRWWLRVPGYYQRTAVCITHDGSIDYRGEYVNQKYLCVRPALWIKLKG